MKIIGMGEILIDFQKINENGNIIYKPNLGGAPLNVLCALSRMGLDTEFIGCVGEDSFGDYLIESVNSFGINSKSIQRTNRANTTLAFVHLDKSGERTFTFYRDPGADEMVEYRKVSKNIMDDIDVFHFGSLSLINEKSKQTTLRLKELAISKGVMVTFDPNIRENLWKELNTSKKVILDAMEGVHILKVSQEELKFLFGNDEIEINARTLIKTYGIKLIDITLGENGSILITKDKIIKGKGFKVNAIDTTGAGDSHLAAIIYKVLEYKKTIENLSNDELYDIVNFANKYSSVVTTRYGSASSMPYLYEIK